MLEVRYNKKTGEVTGWWGNRHGNHEAKLKNRPNGAIVLLDIDVPDKPLEAWLYKDKKLVANPDYVEPLPPRDLFSEVDELKARIIELERTR